MSTTSPATEIVWNTLRQRPHGMTADTCSRCVGLSHSTARKHLNILADMGYARRTDFVLPNGRTAILFSPKPR